MLALFEMMSLETWVKMLQRMNDATEPGLAPEFDHNKWADIYVLMFLFVASFFDSVMIGVIVRVPLYICIYHNPFFLLHIFNIYIYAYTHIHTRSLV